MKKTFFSLSTLIFSILAFANCPPASDQVIQQVCKGNQFSSTCNWQASWYEGYTEGHFPVDKKDKVITFVKAFWGMKDGQKTGDGSTLCYYKTQDGRIVMMGQNSWGNVPQPSGNNWSAAVDDEGHPGKVCTQNCFFPYGS